MRKSRQWKGLSLLVLVASMLILVAMFGEWIAPYDPLATDFSKSLLPPGGDHMFGTDLLGRDIWSRILCGASESFFLTFVMVAIVSILGTTIGMIAGYLGKGMDTVLMRMVDVLLAFPDSIFAIAVAGIVGAGLVNTVLALGIVWWTKYARLTRNMVMDLKQKEFIIQAKFSGANTAQIIRKYIFPNIVPQIIIMATLDIGGMMLALAGLSFLGLTSQPPSPEWGAMLYESKQYMQSAPWMMIYPGLALFITVAIFNLLGDALRDRLDPHERKGEQ